MLSIVAAHAHTPPVWAPNQGPRLRFAHGGGADFAGRDNATYNILSVPRLSFSLGATATSSILTGYAPMLVHGTFFDRAYWTVKSTTNATIKLEAHAAAAGFLVGRDGGPLQAHGSSSFDSVDGITVLSCHGGKTVAVRAHGWETNVTRKPVFNRVSGSSHRFDVTVRPLDGTPWEGTHGSSHAERVAPHGLLGQSFDGDAVAVDGARENYYVRVTELTTSAQADGAIEGVARDYELVPATDPFSTRFRYSRFDSVADDVATAGRKVRPRDVAALSGTHHHALIAATSMADGGDGIAGDIAAIIDAAARGPQRWGLGAPTKPHALAQWHRASPHAPSHQWAQRRASESPIRSDPAFPIATQLQVERLPEDCWRYGNECCRVGSTCDCPPYNAAEVAATCAKAEAAKNREADRATTAPSAPSLAARPQVVESSGGNVLAGFAAVSLPPHMRSI